MSYGRIVILSGPSGSGKTTLHEKLLASRRFRHILVRSISATTRPRRTGERAGRDYLFLTEKMFRYKARAGHFLEWMKVFGNYYGTPHKAVRELLSQGKHVLLCIDVKGAAVVRRKYPRAVSIFIQPPNVAALKERLRGRQTERGADLKVRLATAREEMREAKLYDHVIINDDLGRAYARLEDILTRELGIGRG